MSSASNAASQVQPELRAKLRVELLIVLGLSLGQSAIYAALQLWNKLTQQVPLNQQVTSINTSAAPDRPWLDFAYQLAWVGFPLVPVFLVFYLLRTIHPPAEGPYRVMGFDLKRPWFDLAVGFGCFAVIGAAGLGLYVLARELGLNTTVAAANLTAVWWAIPVLIARAFMNGVLEEVIMVGYLFTRWQQAGGRVLTVLIGSALIRGGYHLYQGFGAFVGNFIMGVLFGWLYLKTKRVMPLVLIHAFLDIAAFVGYALLKDHLSWL